MTVDENKIHEFYDWDDKLHHMSVSQIKKHIPKRLSPHVDGVFIDSDGGWVWLKDTAVNTMDDCHTIHFYTLRELDSELKSVKIN